MIAGGIGGLLIAAAVVFNAFWKGTNHDEAASAATITPVAIITPTATILPTPFIEAPGRIAFESKRDGNEIYVMNADGSAQTHLTNNQADYNEPTWSADRHKIAFHSYRDGIIE